MKRNMIGHAIQGWLLASSLAVAGCSGSVDIGGDAAGGTAGTWPAGAGGSSGSAGDPSPQGGATGGSYGAGAGSGGAPVVNYPACAAPAGAVATLDTTEFYDAIVGRWLICAGGLSLFVGAPGDVVGVEYEAPSTDGTIQRGNMYYLVDSPDGAVRGSGFDYQLTYDVSPQDPADGPPVQLNIHPTPQSGFDVAFKSSLSPRQWQFSGGSANPDTSALLVPAD
ncbi:MAG: hypothetical protein ABW061_09545 [Polyangiaceae bacterium]